MALPVVTREHNYVLIKSESTLMQWTCNLCYNGPLWAVYECTLCKRKVCSSGCMSKDMATNCPG